MTPMPAPVRGRSLRQFVLVEAPSNLGLRPPRPGHEPGTWRAPAALSAAGLKAALRPGDVISLSRPTYDFDAQPGTRLRNGRTIRSFNEELAASVEGVLRRPAFPVVIGGDCSILLGCLAGARRFSELSLVHIDGHSDFRHPSNYDPRLTPGAVAGMDLALATGRGESILTVWDDRPPPLVPDEHVIQIGERENRMADFAWPDILETSITRIDIFWLREHGVRASLDRARGVLVQAGDLPFWLHLDVDVLDQALMPAVDSPGSPGTSFAETSELIAGFVSLKQCIGIDVTIFDPDLDPDGRHARALVRMLGDGLAALREGDLSAT